MTTSLKLAFVSVTAAAALLACSAASPTDEGVDVDVEADQTDTACMKGLFCKPPVSGGSSGVTSSSGMVYDPGPFQGPEIPCSGPGPGGLSPVGDPATYRPIKAPGDNATRCWSSWAKYTEVGIPHGFALLSQYVCLPPYPVNRCDVYNRCYCWSY